MIVAHINYLFFQEFDEKCLRFSQLFTSMWAPFMHLYISFNIADPSRKNFVSSSKAAALIFHVRGNSVLFACQSSLSP